MPDERSHTYVQLVSASSLSDEQGSGDSEEDEFEDAQEFYDCVDNDVDGKTTVEAEEKLGEEAKVEPRVSLCQDDERAAQTFQALLQSPGIGSDNWAECPDMEGNDAFQVRSSVSSKFSACGMNCGS